MSLFLGPSRPQIFHLSSPLPFLPCFIFFLRSLPPRPPHPSSLPALPPSHTRALPSMHRPLLRDAYLQWCGGSEQEPESINARLLDFTAHMFSNTAYQSLYRSIACNPNFELCPPDHAVSSESVSRGVRRMAVAWYRARIEFNTILLSVRCRYSKNINPSLSMKEKSNHHDIDKARNLICTESITNSRSDHADHGYPILD